MLCRASVQHSNLFCVHVQSFLFGSCFLCLCVLRAEEREGAVGRDTVLGCSEALFLMQRSMLVRFVAVYVYMFLMDDSNTPAPEIAALYACHVP